VIRMSCNQLVVLADCYRRRLDAANHPGTFNEDVHFLHRHGLLYRAEGDRWRVTDAGRDFVERTIGRDETPDAGAVLLEPAQDTPAPPPAGVTFLVWEGGGENKNGGLFLQTGFAEYEAAKRFCLEGVKTWAEGRHHMAHYGTVENGRLEYFDVVSVPTTPHGCPSVQRRWAIQQLVHGTKSC